MPHVEIPLATASIYRPEIRAALGEALVPLSPRCSGPIAIGFTGSPGSGFEMNDDFSAWVCTEGTGAISAVSLGSPRQDELRKRCAYALLSAWDDSATRGALRKIAGVITSGKISNDTDFDIMFFPGGILIIASPLAWCLDVHDAVGPKSTLSHEIFQGAIVPVLPTSGSNHDRLSFAKASCTYANRALQDDINGPGGGRLAARFRDVRMRVTAHGRNAQA